MYKSRRSIGVVAVALLLSGCGSGADAVGTADADEGQLAVVASFYPLEYVAARIGGGAVAVQSLTKAGAEPHDLELTPRDVAAVSDADVVVYLSGFQPAVDEAVTQEASDTSIDVAPVAHLDLTFAGHGDESPEGAVDPHFWLDPLRLADVGDAVAARLSEIDPAGAPGFTSNAASLRADLDELDNEFSAGLASCASRYLVTSHTAFGYLAERYGFEQIGIAGLAAEEEPHPQDLSSAAEFITDHDVQTVYFETLVSPAIAETVAEETGARTAVLDPLEGITDESAGRDYLQVMRANLASLRDGQSCP